jgi:fatty acid desaturase
MFRIAAPRYQIRDSEHSGMTWKRVVGRWSGYRFANGPDPVSSGNVMSDRGRIEWITLGLIAACYGLWAVALFWLWPMAPLAGFTLVTLTIALQSSLTHEVLHGHPFRHRRLNEALMFLPLSLGIPYDRFRDQHLAHHRDSRLTDPYDDPESNYLDPQVWAGLPGWQKALYRANNTLLGRILLGPGIGQVRFMAAEWRGAIAGDRAIRRAWVRHGAGLVLLIPLIMAAPMPVWAYVAAAYLGLGLIKIRTFLEHRAHTASPGRTVIVEDRGPLAWLFLNNNLHAVHHLHPCTPWYRLPQMYRDGRDGYLARNDGYVYRSYGQIFRQYLLTSKDPVAHPLWRRG